MVVTLQGNSSLGGSPLFSPTFSFLTVGYSSFGRADINGGSDLTITSGGYNGVQIGVSRTGNGFLNIDGPGSSLTSSGGAGNINVGRAGDGQLTITNGGSANGFFIVVGRSAGSNGLLQVDGPGSTLTASDEFGNFTTYTGYAGFLRAGRDAGSYGRIEVTNGGTINVQNDPTSNYDVPVVSLGRNYGSTGVLVVDGEGSTLNLFMTGPSDDAPVIGPMPTADNEFNGPYFSLGYRGGTGRATVQNKGAINIFGEDSALEIGQQNIGGAGRNEFSILSGGTVSISSMDNRVGARVTVGREAETEGILRLDGEGSKLEIISDRRDGFEENRTSELLIGERGNGTLRLTGGAEVVIDGANDAYPKFIVGEGKTDDRPAQAEGVALISGSGSKLTLFGSAGTNLGAGAAGLIGVGLHSGSRGTLTIQNGATVENQAEKNSVTIVAGAANTEGTIRVNGATSRFDAGELLVVGAAFDFATGSIDESGGGQGKVFLNGGQLEADRIFVGETGEITGNIVGDARDNALENFGLIDGNVNLGSGNDLLDTRSGQVTGTIKAGAGRDTVMAGDTDDTVDAGLGRDTVFGGAGDDTIRGRRGDDSLSGNGGNDLLAGGIGNDTLNGGSGNDTLKGGALGDVLFGGDGRDTLYGQNGHDTLKGGALGDVLFGGDGRDTLYGQNGNDSLNGGALGDVLIGGSGRDT
ncbi:MAG: hypothetical protein AAFZ46_19425, partial [Pseudomonadota bacterium]